MKLRLITCGEISILDSTTNRVSIINLLDDLSSLQFPILLPTVTALSIFEREAKEPQGFTCELAVSLNGQDLVRITVPADFQDGELHRSLVAFQGFMIPEPGMLAFTMWHGENMMGSWTVMVKQVSASEAVTGQADIGVEKAVG